ncbi:AGRE4 protein, partial [Anseranas semipalmata]|nr:AGRE4 protein [Anseranas semipalmata]
RWEGAMRTPRHAPQALQEDRELFCMSWQLKDSKGLWTSDGCTLIGGDNSSSICSCNHFTSFAILMASRHEPQESYTLKVVTYVGLSVSLLCLFLAIVTFLLCRSLWSVSVSLHLQLSICLFV